MPAAGGAPRQLTYYPARGPCRRAGATTTRSTAGRTTASGCSSAACATAGSPGYSRLYQVSMEGGPSEPLPMPESGAGAFSPGGNQIVYSPRARDFRTEKRYSGGQANQLYIFDVETHAAKKISEGRARQPRPDVDRRLDLLRLRPRRPLQPLPLRHQDREDGAGHLQQSVGRPLAEHRPAEPDRLRVARRARDFRREVEEDDADLDHGAGRRPGAAAGAGQRGEPCRVGARSARKASVWCSARAATSSRRRSRRGRCGT